MLSVFYQVNQRNKRSTLNLANSAHISNTNIIYSWPAEIFFRHKAQTPKGTLGQKAMIKIKKTRAEPSRFRLFYVVLAQSPNLPSDHRSLLHKKRFMICLIVSFDLYTTTAILLICLSVFVIIITFFGCCGAARDNRCMLWTVS